MVITMAKLRMAHASTHGARKPPGPKERAKVGDNNGQAMHGAHKPPWPKERRSTPGPKYCNKIYLSELFYIYIYVTAVNS